MSSTYIEEGDYYQGEEPIDTTSIPAGPVPPLGIGEGASLEQVIVDKNARIGRGVVITPKGDVADFEGPNYWVRDGITVIPKGAVIPDGTVI